MSPNPKTGVVDAHGKVHGMDNLYVAGSSIFPTAGHANPTFTIAAMALRLADHLNALAHR
jgi:choline dehydrogenase-like flavoprotein